MLVRVVERSADGVLAEASHDAWPADDWPWGSERFRPGASVRHDGGAKPITLQHQPNPRPRDLTSGRTHSHPVCSILDCGNTHTPVCTYTHT